MADYKVTDTELTSVANAIRAKTEKSAQLEFPTGFVSAIGDISGSGGGSIVTPDFQGNAYVYMGFASAELWSNTSYAYMNVFPVEANKKYAIFVGENVGNRLIIGFFANLTYNQMKTYFENSNTAAQIRSATNRITPGGNNPLSGDRLKERFIFTPNSNGIILVETNNTSGVNLGAFCVDITSE